MEETPMGYLYNVNCFLHVVRQTEENNPSVQFTDEHHREAIHDGELIRLDGFKTVIERLKQEYDDLVKKEIFFGQEVPENLKVLVDIRSLSDNPRNSSVGFCFLDDNRNKFAQFQDGYACWLLSDRERAQQYAYRYSERLVWKSAPCLALLDAFQRARMKLLVLTIISAGPSVRGTEVSQELLRNTSGAELRNCLILRHNFCIVSIQDKTSHQALRSNFSPHCPSYDISERLIHNLVVFRPFERMLVQFLKGKDCGDMFHFYLWPRYDKDPNFEQVGERPVPGLPWLMNSIRMAQVGSMSAHSLERKRRSTWGSP
jgi:hypothetical protein